MKTIKSYTDIAQSRKLEEILPLESADMHYARIEDDYEIRDWTVYLSPIPKICAVYVENLPCWSLAALLSVLLILDNRSPVLSKTFDRKYRVVYHSTAYERAILTSDYDNPVDACYEMIIKLHELKKL
jgi:hypothetical protein